MEIREMSQEAAMARGEFKSFASADDRYGGRHHPEGLDAGILWKAIFSTES